MISSSSSSSSSSRKIIYAKCGVKNYMNEDHRSYRRNFCGKKAAKNSSSTVGVVMVVVAAATPVAEIINVVVVRVYLR